MGILNFCEIAPPVKITKEKYGGNLDDFEKFAQEFFREIYGANFIEVASRGPDGGRDLLFSVLIDGNLERWVVSCKHKAHGGASVLVDEEKNIGDRFLRAQADVFIGFYSHIAHKALEDSLLELKANPRINFNFRVFNSGFIETELLSAANGKGWFLASRYFPISSRRLFQRILCPVKHYNHDDVLDSKEGRLELHGVGGAIMGYSTEQQRVLYSEEAVKFANDTVTFALNEIFFIQSLSEIIKLWPNCFSYWEACPVDELRPSDVRPTFDVDDILNLFKIEGSGAALTACFIWTWWDLGLSVSIYQRAFELAFNSKISKNNAWENLSMQNALRHSDLERRDKILRFAAFAGTDLTEPTPWKRLVQTAALAGQDSKLDEVLSDIYESLSPEQQVEVRATPNSPALTQLKEYAWVLGAENLISQVEIFKNSLDLMNYRKFKDIVAEGKNWKLIPSETYDWFSENLKSSVAMQSPS